MWQIFVDISGQPPEKIHIGMILVDTLRKAEIINDFYTAFPHLKNYERKSTRVNSECLLEILNFFNDKNLRMVCYHFNDFQWKKHERQLNDLSKELNHSHKYKSGYYRFYEKIIGILYFYAFQQIILNKSHNYEVIACVESNIDIWEVFRTIQKLSKLYGYKIQPNANIRRIEHLLKMADYVAGANRKLERFQLETIPKLKILSDPANDYDLKKIFKLFKNNKILKKMGYAPHSRENL